MPQVFFEIGDMLLERPFHFLFGGKNQPGLFQRDAVGNVLQFPFRDFSVGRKREAAFDSLGVLEPSPPHGQFPLFLFAGFPVPDDFVPFEQIGHCLSPV